MKNPLIALTTDFGNYDPFVGIMKGVIARIAPGAQLVDITHTISPGDIQRGAVVLWQSVPYFPEGTVFLSVVDPGVGTERKGILLVTEGHLLVGPDNGLFSYVLLQSESYKAWELTKLPRANIAMIQSTSSTFHGRDIFAPSAALAALGVAGNEFGPTCDDIARLPSPTLEVPSPQLLRGEVLTIDHFGNLLTSLGKFLPENEGKWQLSPWVGHTRPMVKFSAEHACVELPNGDRLPFVDTFAHTPPGTCAVLVGSTGLLEIVANRQSAAELLKLKRGAKVELHIS